MKGQPSLSALYMFVFEKLQWFDLMRNNLGEKMKESVEGSGRRSVGPKHVTQR